MRGKRHVSIAAIAFCLISSCNAIRVSVAPSFPQDQAKKVAVLEFDHKEYRHTIVDKVSHGVSTAKNPGRLVASLVSVALEDWGKYDVVKRDKITLKLRQKKITEAGVIYEQGRDAVGKLLGVDAVVIGTVDAYESAFILMVQSAKIIFTARCIDIATGQEMWKIHVKMKKHYTSEERLTAGAMREAVARLQADIEKGPVQKPKK